MARDGASVEKGTGYYDTLYGTFAEDLQAAVRAEAFGEEIGQNLWLTADEHHGFFELLGLNSSTYVLGRVTCDGEVEIVLQPSLSDVPVTLNAQAYFSHLDLWLASSDPLSSASSARTPDVLASEVRPAGCSDSGGKRCRGRSGA